MNEIGNSLMSIKQEQDIQSILQQVPINDNPPQLDQQIYQLLQLGQSKLQDEYNQIAERKLQYNRYAVNLDTNMNFFLNQKQQQLSSEESSQENQQQQNFRIPECNQNHNYLISQKIQEKQYILDVFQKEQLQKIKFREDYILELDSKYPKINYMATNRHQYQIFKSTISHSAKWFHVKKKPLNSIKQALIFTHQNIQWNIFNMGEQLIVFIGANWVEPIQILPHKGQPIIKIAKSINNNYIAIALKQQILVYIIKKQTLVLLKSINDLKLQSVTHVSIYSQNPLKLCFVDNNEDIGIISIEQTLIFTRVKVQQIQHQLDMVMDISIIGIGNQTLLAIASRNCLAIYTIEPSSQLICYQKIQKSNLNQVTIRWRTTSTNQFKPQLFVAIGHYIYIYKLSDSTDLQQPKKLILNLIFHNHYEITMMQIITNTHLLVKSSQNLTVVAIPLILTTQNDEENLDSFQYFESAMVYVFCKPQLTLLAFSSQNILFYIGQSKLQVAKLKTLNEQLQDLMLIQGCFRQAFSLLILISKGLNYSFKFSYSVQDLSAIIMMAIHCAIDTLLSITQKYIIIFRIGWVCQLAIQSNNQEMI